MIKQIIDDIKWAFKDVTWFDFFITEYIMLLVFVFLHITTPIDIFLECVFGLGFFMIGITMSMATAEIRKRYFTKK